MQLTSTPKIIRIYSDVALSAYQFTEFKLVEGSSTGFFNSSLQAFCVGLPTVYNQWASLLVVPLRAIAAGTIGLAVMTGLMCIGVRNTEELAAGDSLACVAGDPWGCKVDDDAYGNNDGQYRVIGVAQVDETMSVAICIIRDKEAGLSFNV